MKMLIFRFMFLIKLQVLQNKFIPNVQVSIRFIDSGHVDRHCGNIFIMFYSELAGYFVVAL